MQSNLDRPFKMAELAKSAFLSEAQLRRIFRSVTGEGILPNLMRMRVEKARQLLADTNLTVNEIADAVGFPTHSAFSSYFKRRTGTSPRAFREGARANVGPVTQQPFLLDTGPRLRFSDDFEGRILRSCWKARSGEWKQENGFLTGEGNFDFAICFQNPMPENFRLTYEIRIQAAGDSRAADLHLFLENDRNDQTYCLINVGKYDNSAAEMSHRTLGTLLAVPGRVSKGQWHRVSFELMDDKGLFRFDDKDLFQFRDPFPPPYSARCRFSIGSYRCRIEIRNLRLHDLGFSPLVRAIRQGDLLFNSGFFDRALDFYLRHLQSADVSFVDTVELRYKIAQCFFRQGDRFQAKAWLGKVVVLPETDYWAQQAELVQLEILLAEGELDEFQNKARDWFRNPLMQTGIRRIIREALGELDAKGFHEKQYALAKFMLELNRPGDFGALVALEYVADACQYRNDLSAAEKHYRAVAEWPGAPQEKALLAAYNLGFVLALQGRLTEALRIARGFRERTREIFFVARGETYAAFYERGLGKWECALEELADIEKKYPTAGDIIAFAQMQRAMMLCCLGQTAQTREDMARVQKQFPNYYMLQPGKRSYYLYVPELVDGRFKEAIKLLLDDARRDDNDFAEHDRQFIKAGLIAEYSGYLEVSREILSESLRRFPANRCGFLPLLAKHLLENKGDELEKMEYPGWHRSEVFYLAGLMYERRGNPSRSRELLKMSLKADPTLRWPAYLARERLRREEGLPRER